MNNPINSKPRKPNPITTKNPPHKVKSLLVINAYKVKPIHIIVVKIPAINTTV